MAPKFVNNAAQGTIAAAKHLASMVKWCSAITIQKVIDTCDSLSSTVAAAVWDRGIK